MVDRTLKSNYYYYYTVAKFGQISSIVRFGPITSAVRFGPISSVVRFGSIRFGPMSLDLGRYPVIRFGPISSRRHAPVVTDELLSCLTLATNIMSVLAGIRILITPLLAA